MILVALLLLLYSFISTNPHPQNILTTQKRIFYYLSSIRTNSKLQKSLTHTTDRKKAFFLSDMRTKSLLAFGNGIDLYYKKEYHLAVRQSATAMEWRDDRGWKSENDSVVPELLFVTFFTKNAFFLEKHLLISEECLLLHPKFKKK